MAITATSSWGGGIASRSLAVRSMEILNLNSSIGGQRTAAMLRHGKFSSTSTASESPDGTL